MDLPSMRADRSPKTENRQRPVWQDEVSQIFYDFTSWFEIVHVTYVDRSVVVLSGAFHIYIP